MLAVHPLIMLTQLVIYSGMACQGDEATCQLNETLRQPVGSEPFLGCSRLCQAEVKANYMNVQYFSCHAFQGEENKMN